MKLGAPEDPGGAGGQTRPGGGAGAPPARAGGRQGGGSAGGGIRTRTGVNPGDFKSPASASFATPASFPNQPPSAPLSKDPWSGGGEERGICRTLFPSRSHASSLRLRQPAAVFIRLPCSAPMAGILPDTRP